MKTRILYSIIIVAGILFITACKQNNKAPQNLVINGSAELPRYDSTPKGWVNVQGHWVAYEGDSVHHDSGFAQDGKYYFFAGNDSLGILQQDVNVSNYASEIDAQKQQFVLTGFEQSLDQGPNSDQGMIMLRALDSSKSKTLYTLSSDTERSLSKWLLIKDSFAVPPYTRFIRVQLIAIRHVGGDNDGYLDNISVIASPAKNGYLKFILITAIICILVVGFTLISKTIKSKKLQ